MQREGNLLTRKRQPQAAWLFPELTFGFSGNRGHHPSSVAGQTAQPLSLPLHINRVPVGFPQGKLMEQLTQLAKEHRQPGELPRMRSLDGSPAPVTAAMDTAGFGHW